MRDNLILDTDSYKHSHFKQYPPGTTCVSSYIEAREGSGYQDVTFFGLQMFLLEYLSKPITAEDIRVAKQIVGAHGLPFNEEGWNYILENYNGYLPLEIEALPEGTVVPRGTPLVQVRNTDPNCFWLTSFMETALLRAVWYPTTIATLSRHCKAMINHFLTRTSDNPEAGLPFKLHDFGARGVAAKEQAGIGGAAHLVNFAGTDTLSGLVYANIYYSAGIAGWSVPASEHSTMTSWGEEGETEAYRNMLTTFPSGIVSIVSDSYDLKAAVDEIFGQELKEIIVNRDGITVIRPDSGDPEEMVMFCLESLGNRFGTYINKKGYRVLNDKVRVIQGDGVDDGAILKIMDRMRLDGWSLDNLTFGMGGGLLQKVNRDTLRFAMKASARKDIDGWSEVGKNPKTDPTKASKKGLLAVYRGPDGEVTTVSSTVPLTDPSNLLRPVYRMVAGYDAPKIITASFSEIRARAAL